MTHHTLKLAKRWYDAKLAGLKPWELRLLKDRVFQAGDKVTFVEVDGDRETGRTLGPLGVEITWVLNGAAIDNPYDPSSSGLLDQGMCIFTHSDPHNVTAAAHELVSSYESIRDAMAAGDPILEHYASMRLGVATSSLAVSIGRPDPNDENENVAAAQDLHREVLAILRRASQLDTPLGLDARGVLGKITLDAVAVDEQA